MFMGIHFFLKLKQVFQVSLHGQGNPVPPERNQWFLHEQVLWDFYSKCDCLSGCISGIRMYLVTLDRYSS